MRLDKTVTILTWGRWNGTDGKVRGKLREKPAFPVIKGCRHHVSLGLEPGKNFFRVVLVFKGQRRRAIGGEDFAQRGELSNRRLSERHEFKSEKRSEHQHHDHDAGQQNDRGQFPPDRYVPKWHSQPFSPVTISAGRSNLDLSVRPADFAVSKLIFNLILLFSV